MSPPLSLSNVAQGLKVRVQPAVLLSICDAYVRRNSKQSRVVGTLLGQIVDGFVEIKDCYAVPHNETPDSVDFDIPHHSTMKELHQRVNPKEAVVGWFTTGSEEQFNGRDNLIQDYYGSECQNPIILTVDTAITNEKIDVAAFLTRSLSLSEKSLAIEFQPLDCEVRALDLDKLGGELMSLTEKPTADIDQLSSSMTQLQECISKVSNYVDDVVDGKIKADPHIGRFIADTVLSVPNIQPDDLEQLVADSAQDSLLIMYLANLVRTQLALADRLGTAALALI